MKHLFLSCIISGLSAAALAAPSLAQTSPYRPSVPEIPQMPTPPNMQPPAEDFLDLTRNVVQPKLITAPSPIMPDGAERSGYCCVDFDIGTEGRAINTTTSYCSEPLFTTAAIAAVERAEFSPALVGGVRRVSDGHSFDVTFRRETVRGDIIPSADGRFDNIAAASGTSLCPYP